MSRNQQNSFSNSRNSSSRFKLKGCLIFTACALIILLIIAAFIKLMVYYTCDGVEYDGYLGHTATGTTFNGELQTHYTLRPGTTAIQKNVNTNSGIFNVAEVIDLPDSLVTIGDQVFMSTTGLKSIVIPNSVASMGSQVFESCTDLESVTLSERLTEIPDSCFSWCKSLKSIDIPNGVTSIGSNAFEGCSSLKSVVIPNSVAIIAGSAFAECTNLSEVTLSDRVTIIKPFTFFGCEKLKSIVIPDSVSLINARAFELCSGLETVSVSGSTQIEPNAFPPNTKIIKRPAAASVPKRHSN